MRAAELRAIAARALEDEPAPQWIAVAAAPEWDDAATLDHEGTSLEVVPCVSVLAVREQLVTPPDEGVVRVLLTDRSDAELGEEARAKIWRGHVQNPTGWQHAMQLFRVDALDAKLADYRWLVELLVDIAPPRGFPPAPSGYLDFDRAWQAFLRHGLRFSADEPSLGDLLLWTASDHARRLTEAPIVEHAGSIGAELVRTVGDLAPVVLDMVRRGEGADALPLGLVAGALWGDAVDASATTVIKARGRLEQRAHTTEISERLGRAWADAAHAVVTRTTRAGDSERAELWVDRAEVLLSELNAVDLASGSAVLHQGFENRLLDLGRAMTAALESNDPEQLHPVERALDLAQQHRDADFGDGPDRVRRARMALRLCRRLHTPPAPGEDFPTLASHYLADGAWVDHAREALDDGETVMGLAAAYRELSERIDALRAQRDREFAEALSGWSTVSPTSSDAARPIERVLDELVVPVAKSAPVLLLVLDGLSHPEELKLRADLKRLGWKPHTQDGAPLPPTVAALPTVTQVSRTSLLTGCLMEGAQKEEVEGFTSHTGLREVSGSSTPVLFHKKDLKVEAGQIAPDVHQAIVDPDQRVVGAVVNAVDDHLDKGSQLRLANGLRALKPLRPLLGAAAEGNRVVIIVSDHGHVLERGCTVKLHDGSGERWRPAVGAASDLEVLVEGPRVVKGGGGVIVPAAERLRYIAPEKRGYHGGATPQEVLCPTVLLFPGSIAIEGWMPFEQPTPAWWRGEEAPEIPEVLPPAAATPAVDEQGQGVLFSDGSGQYAPTPAAPETWIEAVLSSDLWRAQTESAARARIDDDTTRTILTVLDARSGTASAALLAEALSTPVVRVRGKLAALQQFVNVDGYAILTIESDGTARLDVETLRTQFGVEA